MKEGYLFSSVFAFLCGSRRVKKLGLSPETTNMLMQNVEKKARAFALRFLKVMENIIFTLFTLVCILYVFAGIYIFIEKSTYVKWVTYFTMACVFTCVWYTVAIIGRDITYYRKRLESQSSLFSFLYEDESRK